VLVTRRKAVLNDSATLNVPLMFLNQLRQKIGVTFGSWPGQRVASASEALARAMLAGSNVPSVSARRKPCLPALGPPAPGTAPVTAATATAENKPLRACTRAPEP
jgi:hypothetical protein